MKKKLPEGRGVSWSASAVLHRAGQLVMKAVATRSRSVRLLPASSLLTSPIYCSQCKALEFMWDRFFVWCTTYGEFCFLQKKAYLLNMI